MDAALRQIIDRVRDSADRRSAVRICGGGTKDFHGPGAPQHAGEPLDMRPLAGVVSYEPSELVVTVRSGTLLADLESLLAEQGQCLPFEPPHFGAGATVGGMVSAGLAGPARASVGSVRDYVLGAQMLNGRAEVLNFGGTVMKNVAGYDVSRVLAGSFGTLGLITQVSLKVLPVAPAEATLRFECSQELALRWLNEWGGRPLPLNASRWSAENGGTLHLRLRGAIAAVDAACAQLGGQRQDPGASAQQWEACREQRLDWFATSAREGRVLWRVSVPQTAPALAVPADMGEPLIEWHGGQRWYAAAPEASAPLREAARQAGGHVTLFRAAPAAALAARFDALDPAISAIHRALKREFDPDDIFPESPWRN